MAVSIVVISLLIGVLLALPECADIVQRLKSAAR